MILPVGCGAICVQAAFKKQILLRYAGIGGAYGREDSRYSASRRTGSSTANGKAHAVADRECQGLEMIVAGAVSSGVVVLLALRQDDGELDKLIAFGCKIRHGLVPMRSGGCITAIFIIL